jgi:glycosyltransferase involved in cell wall biosynthesis
MTQNKVAVITPYYKESVDILRKCHDSVMAQNLACDHIMVADGYPCEEIANWKIQHIVLPSSHGDYGNTARGLGGIFAAQHNYEFIAYLDADNWFKPHHIESLVTLQNSTQFEVCASLREFYTDQGVCMNGLFEKAENTHQHIDTNCLLIHRKAFQHLNFWLKIPMPLSVIGDRVFYQGLLRAGYRFSHSDLRTICYRTLYKVHYSALGLPVPDNAKEISSNFKNYLRSIQGIQACVESLGFIPRV